EAEARTRPFLRSHCRSLTRLAAARQWESRHNKNGPHRGGPLFVMGSARYRVTGSPASGNVRSGGRRRAGRPTGSAPFRASTYRPSVNFRSPGAVRYRDVNHRTSVVAAWVAPVSVVSCVRGRFVLS